MTKKSLFGMILFALLITTISFAQQSNIYNKSGQNQHNPNSKKEQSTPTKPTSSNWVTIPYGEFIDKSILTHSGKTVGDVIQQIPSQGGHSKGLVQQYLESYSILCHDKLLSIIKPDIHPLVNILTHYPIGSEQPAWVGLFREGQFQLYYNKNLIRVFLEGTDPKSSFEKYRSIIRLPIRDVINSEGMSIENIEVYVFTNDYATTKIRLNTIPITYAINNINLSTKRKSIDLDSIEEFLKSGVILEAVEVDKNNNLFFYGRRDSNQTIADQPVSLSDIAVVYRSVFHYGYNAPYISLDNNEDNRYAKVNFGGHLENTHVGYVTLEADKLFKTLSSGIDPNTHELVKVEITKDVPGFLTEDERRFLEDYAEEYSHEIRYWFYPDNIGTVTNGSIGAVQTYQFLADAERMDVKVTLDKATRETINHLNTNFIQYERAEKTYKELSTVGRIFALVNWLKEMNMGEKIELDDLLSVKIPAFSTPEKTKKMIAITAGSYSEDLHISSRNVRDYTKTYYISHLLDKYPPSTSDKEFIKIADNYSSQIDTHELDPPHYKEIKSKVDYDKGLINSNNEKIGLLKKEIEGEKETLDRSSSSDIDQYNNLIGNYNNLVADQKSLINGYNSNVNELNSMKIRSRVITSIGGGISLNPESFKRTVVDRNSPKIGEIVRIKSQLKPFGNTAKSGDWIRSNSGIGGARINKLSHTP